MGGEGGSGGSGGNVGGEGGEEQRVVGVAEDIKISIPTLLFLYNYVHFQNISIIKRGKIAPFCTSLSSCH